MFLPFSRRAGAWEPNALALRRVAGVGADGKLDPWALAPKVGLLVIDPNTILELLDEDARAHLFDGARGKWSGGVYPLPLPDGMRVCVLNPTHSHRRNKITLMEEVAHIHLEHKPTQMIFQGDGVSVRDFNEGQEAEAYGVGAAALLPWSSFYQHLNRGASVAELAELYDVTEQLVKYRIKITAASNLYKARQRASSTHH